ncbi:glycerate kinase type-2 family protein [Cognatishimia activa]|uniref:glycerate kinase type-2 family protein n=1 Tax=Cognatishimia activa TaxID=1715691 RepID=UPI00222E5195|nr:glycerate kinase [Cognatishimia activa]UZD90382.1 glycerate kinase [Cognatishimia activa]
MRIDQPERFLSELFELAVKTADPMQVIPKHLPPRPKGRLLVIGAGKASARMAEAVESVYGPCEGLVITRYGYARPCKGIEIVEAAHPVPDQSGVDATARMLDLVSELQPEDTVLALISGGGSALLCSPIEGLTLSDKQAVNAALLASGAPISEMNTVRARLSKVKGGRLATACSPAQLLSLIISDVPGDDPAEIASGPTVPGSSTNEEALAVIDRHEIPVDEKVIRLLSAPQEKLSGKATAGTSVIVAAPSQSLAAAADLAKSQGCEVTLLGDALEGEARDLGRSHAELALKVQSQMTAGSAPHLLLSGGECTVTRIGNGIGGPNAEYALAAGLALTEADGIHLIACDTDGVDGAAEVAGAYFGPETLQSEEHYAIAEASLGNNDAHSFFSKLGGQIICGPTLTNVNDFRAILIFPKSES